MGVPIPLAPNRTLETAIMERLEDDPLCKGKVQIGTVKAIMEDIDAAMARAHNKAIHAAADLAVSMRGNRAEMAGRRIRELRIDRNG